MAKVTPIMNKELQKVFIKVEIEEVSKQMTPLKKSLGPDGYGAYFYQAYWNIVGEKFSKIILNFLNGEGG